MSASAVEVDSKGSCRILVCGGRNFADQQYLMDHLDKRHAFQPITCIIEGGARGADSMARTWAILRGVPYEEYKANWDNGTSAGPRRNHLMLKQGKPDMVIAFQGGTGTAHMCKIAQEAGIDVVRTWLRRK